MDVVTLHSVLVSGITFRCRFHLLLGRGFFHAAEAGTQDMVIEHLTLDDAAGLVMASRISILTKLRDLADEDWDARAIHATFGEIDVRGLVLEILAHDEEHRASLVYSAVT